MISGPAWEELIERCRDAKQGSWQGGCYAREDEAGTREAALCVRSIYRMHTLGSALSLSYLSASSLEPP